VLSSRVTFARRTLAATLAAGILAGGGIVAGSAGAEDAPDATVVPAPAASQPVPIGAVQEDQADALRVLRRAPVAADEMPAAARDAAGPGLFGRNPDLARAIATPTGTGWVVPGDDTVCVVVPDPVDGYATSCSPTAVVATGGLTVGLADADSSTAVALVPDGAKVTVVDDEDHRSRVTPDASGGVAGDAQDADHLDLVTAEGRAETRLVDADELQRGPTG
jgi:hypothetical protein